MVNVKVNIPYMDPMGCAGCLIVIPYGWVVFNSSPKMFVKLGHLLEVDVKNEKNT